MLSILKYKKRYERSFHLNTITSVALNSQGSIFAAGSLDGNVSVWAVDTGSALHRINARTPVHSLVWSTDVEGFVFGCENGVLVSVLLEEVRLSSLFHSVGIHNNYAGMYQNRIFPCPFWANKLYIATLQQQFVDFWSN